MKDLEVIMRSMDLITDFLMIIKEILTIHKLKDTILLMFKDKVLNYYNKAFRVNKIMNKDLNQEDSLFLKALIVEKVDGFL